MSARPRYQVVTAPSGACAMLDREAGEVMHPHGALLESRTLYVQGSELAARLRQDTPEPLVVLDVGLGAGSNAASAMHVALSRSPLQRPFRLLSFDLTLAPFELALRCDPSGFGFTGEVARAARQLLAQGRYESGNVCWELAFGDALERLGQLPSASADIVFWDPFSPRKDARMWSCSALQELRRVCRASATVHTYSGATATRTALLLAGFRVGKGVSSSEKQKHTTVAALPPCELRLPLDSAWLAALQNSALAFPADAPSDAFERVAAAPQFAMDARIATSAESPAGEE